MSVLGLPSNISSLDEKFQASLRRFSVLIDKTRLDLTKICLYNTNLQERLKNQLNYMIAKHQIFKLQIQIQVVSGSDISISKSDCVNIGFNPLKVTTDVYSNHDAHKSHLRNQTQFLTSLNCDLESNITMPTSRNMFVSADLATGISAGLDPVRGIYRFFREPFLIGGSFRFFVFFDEGLKLSSQLWMRMARDIIYILSRYILCSYFVQ